MDWKDSKVRENRIISNIMEWKNLVKCSKCGYKWKTKSLLMWVTCPNCRLKTKNQTLS